MAKRLTLRVPEEQYNLLIKDGKNTGNSVSSIIRVAINNYLLEKEKQ